MNEPETPAVLPDFPCRQGKVRDVYDLGDRLAIVASDRISAFDWVLPTPIPDKGRVLTSLTLFWLNQLAVSNHFLSADLPDLPAPFRSRGDWFAGRTMLVRKAHVVPFECVVRGFLAGSGWKEYQQNDTVCGIPLPAGLLQCQELPEPIFTPATKAVSGHDENVPFDRMAAEVGHTLAEKLRALSLDAYRRGRDHARTCGILLADTKFEWGTLPDGTVLLIDEVLTPDSSRFWPAEDYRPGANPPSYDKQFVRDWLEGSGWNKNSPPPDLPADIVARTREKYLEAHRRLTGRDLPL